MIKCVGDVNKIEKTLIDTFGEIKSKDIHHTSWITPNGKKIHADKYEGHAQMAADTLEKCGIYYDYDKEDIDSALYDMLKCGFIRTVITKATARGEDIRRGMFNIQLTGRPTKVQLETIDDVYIDTGTTNDRFYFDVSCPPTHHRHWLTISGDSYEEFKAIDWDRC